MLENKILTVDEDKIMQEANMLVARITEDNTRR